ncbi:class I SAM-dependent methyltransferase [Nocardia sp. NBC_00511]|uniref:class I SAM-dependent methyltransferase n=1 Tax=Nocardia sp. NBC_00511 TaxID=2903591 RepID=UPI0030E528EC
MTSNKQVSRTESPEIGALITWPRRYRLLTDVHFMGRAGTLIRHLATASGIRPGDHAIDIGCGPGRLANELARQAGPQGRVLGIDPAAEMISYASAHAAPNCRFELGAAQSLSQPDASFDVVTSTFAIHHIPQSQRRAALETAFRVLRPGGRLLLADGHPSGGRLGGLAFRAMALVVAHRDMHGGGGSHGHGGAEGNDALDVRRYRPLLNEIGFTAVDFKLGPFSVGILTAVKPD